MKLQSTLSIPLLISAFLGCTPSNETPPDDPPSPVDTLAVSSLTIMTFNAEFLWDGVAPEQGNVDFPWKNNPTLASERMKKIAEVIRRADADIVNLVEIENLAALEQLNREHLADLGYNAYLVEGRDTYTGQDVALLSRIPPEGNTIAPDFRKGSSGGIDKAVSKNYNARFTIGDTKLAVIGLHFLAQPDREDRRFERQAQADAIRRMALDHLDDGYLPVVLGDFNDYDGEENSQDHLGNVPITFVVSSIKAMDPENLNDDLVNVAKFIPEEERYTAFWDRNGNKRIERGRELTSIDHILISNALADRVERAWIAHDHDPNEVSDHFPVIVRLRLAGKVVAETGPRPVKPDTGGEVVVNLEPGKLIIGGLLPDPEGSDNENEEARIANRGDVPVDMRGWKLRDKSGKTWSLDQMETIGAGEEKSIRRSGQSMDLNNNGDTIELLDPSGKVVDSMTYGAVRTGIWLTPVAS